MKIAIVEMSEPHHSFVIANWIMNYYELMHYPQPPKTAALLNHQAMIKRLGHLHGYVAVNAEDADQLVGFVASRGDMVHFIYVKELFRGLGVARALFEAAGRPNTYTHITRGLRERLPRSMVFNPYRFFLGDNYERPENHKHRDKQANQSRAGEACSIDPRDHYPDVNEQQI
jgi:GNAT superfamily N-acetyltransferase